MSSARQTVLARLLRATKEPPPPESDPEAVMDAAASCFEARAPMLAELDAIEKASADEVPSEVELKLKREILARDERWAEALKWARHGLVQRRQSVARLRRVRSLDSL